MALLLVPYNNAMRLGQGCALRLYADASWNADFTPDEGDTDSQALVVTPTISAVSRPNNGTTGAKDALVPELTALAITSPSAAPSNPNTALQVKEVRYPSQIVTYTSKYVNKLSDVSNDMNVSGSLSIRYGEISGGASGSYVDTDTFQSSDLNFLISVKVVNQTINVRDQLAFWPLAADVNATIDDKAFTQTYGDTFISGFQEGGQFYAIVSITSFDKSNKTAIEAAAHVALNIGAGSVEGDASVKLAKAAMSKESQINITVNWSGGGQLKEGSETWTVDTLTEVAVRFPDLVARCPQRTHAILTQYSALRGYLDWKQATTGSPLDYELASLYTSDLLDVYMGYKSIWKDIHNMIQDLDAGILKVATSSGPTNASSVSLPDLKALVANTAGSSSPSNNAIQTWWANPVPFTADYVGLDMALKISRTMMVLIVVETDLLAKDPGIAVDINRPSCYTRPQIFRQYLPSKVPPKSAPTPPPTPPPTQGPVVQMPAMYTSPTTTPIKLIFQDQPVALGLISVEVTNMDPYSVALSSVASHTPAGTVAVSPTQTVTVVAPPAPRSVNVTSTALLLQNPMAYPVFFGSDNLVLRQDPTTNIYSDNVRRAFPVSFGNVVPQVVAWISGFNLSLGAHVGVAVVTKDIDNEGFSLIASCPAQAGGTAVSVTWIALPPNQTGLRVGTLATASGATGLQFDATAGFTRAPQVVWGLSSFDAPTKDWLRVSSSLSNVTTAGFDYHIGSFDTSMLFSATATYIAWQ